MTYSCQQIITRHIRVAVVLDRQVFFRVQPARDDHDEVSTVDVLPCQPAPRAFERERGGGERRLPRHRHVPVRAAVRAVKDAGVVGEAVLLLGFRAEV